ncbi:AraC family transcriptional regulator [Ancylomarina sp. DW003]|nr:AraC family transcriptional regulator [Ancylomarina sp. DW003]MDE5421152.1 AraC family transcriptional regulator [Ancylomarina sp. DW003]
MSTEDYSDRLKLIQCENFDIAASCEAQYGETERFGKYVYYPATFLFYVEDGVLDIKHENKVYTYPAGSYCLVRKYTHAFFSQTFEKKVRMARSYTFVMPDEFLRKILDNYKFDKNLEPIGDRIIEIPQAESLQPIIQDVKYAVDNNRNLDTKEVGAKVENTLKAIINSNPELAIVFKEFSLAQRADIAAFVNTNYMKKLPLEVMATMCGRSLSTFEREFKLIFNETPHQWILKKRLQYASRLLAETHLKVSDVFVEAGFEDLAHFSKTFKKKFGINPSKVKRRNTEPVHAFALI